MVGNAGVSQRNLFSAIFLELFTKQFGLVLEKQVSKRDLENCGMGDFKSFFQPKVAYLRGTTLRVGLVSKYFVLMELAWFQISGEQCDGVQSWIEICYQPPSPGGLCSGPPNVADRLDELTLVYIFTCYSYRTSSRVSHWFRIRDKFDYGADSSRDAGDVSADDGHADAQCRDG